MFDNETQKSLVRDRFDRESCYWLNLYSENGFVSHSFVDRQRSTLSLVPSVWDGQGRKALDVGCGAGFASIELGLRGFEVIGLDISESIISIARKNKEKRASSVSCRFEVGDFDKTDFGDDSFDVVVGLGFLEYIPDQVHTISKLCRILKPGGIAVVTVPNNHRINYLLNPLRNFNFSLRRYCLEGIKRLLSCRIFSVLCSSRRHSHAAERIVCAEPMPHRNTYTPSSLDCLFESSGFVKVAYIGHEYGPFSFGRKKLFSDATSQRIGKSLYRISQYAPFKFLQKLGGNYIASYQKVAKC